MDKRIGAQYYTVHEYCKTLADFDESSKKVKDIGYKTVQISGIGDFTAEEIKNVLDKYDLEAVCTHRPLAEYEEDLNGIIKFHNTLDCKISGIGNVPNMAGDFEVAKEFVKKINPIAKELKKNGLTFAYHNHHYEFEKRDGISIFDIISENTDPDDFKFIVDVYWVAYAGLNPAKFVRKFKDRIACVHLKDMGIIGRDINMFEVGYGNLDWDDILAACEEANVEYAQVEQDRCNRNPFESLKMSYDFLCTKGFC